MAQPANYISNGSFEDKYSCDFPYDLRAVVSWSSIDSAAVFSGIFCSVCNSMVPSYGGRYQFPKTGQTYLYSTFYNVNGGIGYQRNRLKSNLTTGKTYCVKFYVNIINPSPRGIDGFGIYFGDDSIDTISKCNRPLTYLTPQVSNPQGNVITDTLNWVPVTGTFVANGTEKFALIGNFLADNVVTTASINTPYYPQVWTDALIDDVSCIDIDLPAFAGRDTSAVAGSTVYLGRPRDVGIDEACTWYQLPDINTPIANAAGITVTVAGTATYMVRQIICGRILLDQVVVSEEPLGLRSNKERQPTYRLYPQPAQDQLHIEGPPGSSPLHLEISNAQGQVLLRQEFFDFNGRASQSLHLEPGLYFVSLKDEQGLGSTTTLLVEQ